MMNRKTRRLSKFPEKVKDELSPHYLESPLISPVIDQSHYEKIDKLDDDTADYNHSDLKVSIMVALIQIIVSGDYVNMQ